MSEDMSNLMAQISNMINNNEIPDDIKKMVSNLSSSMQNNNAQTNNFQASSSQTYSQNNSQNDMSSHSTSTENSSMPEFDMATIMKMKKIMDSMKENHNDPRANLLKSLKPYLKESRKEKVDQYIQLFGMGKVFEMLRSPRR